MRRWLRRIAISAFVLACAVSVLAAVLVYALRFPFVQSPLGQIITAIAQRPGHFFVRVGNVRGKPPWNVQVDKVEIGDAAGVWLVIEDAEADWHPFDIWHALDDTHLRVNVDRVHARRLLWTRLPVDRDEPGEKPFRWDRFPRIIAADLTVDEFEVGPGLLGGGHAVMRARGNGILGEWEHGRLDLTLERIDDKRGQARIDLTSDGSPPRFYGSVVAEEEAGGALAYLARLREAGAVKLRVETAGPLREWIVRASVDADALGKLDAQAGIAFGPTGAISITGTFDPVAQQRERYLVGRGAPMPFELRGAWIPDDVVRLDRGRLEADGRVLQASGRLDLAAMDRPYEVAATLSRSAAAADHDQSVQLGPFRLATARLDARGMIGPETPDEIPGAAAGVEAAPAATAPASGSGVTITATLEAENPATGSLRASKLGGVLQGAQRGGDGPLVFTLALHANDLVAGDSVVPLLGATPSLQGNGEAALGDGVLSFEQVELRGDAAHAEGTVDIGDAWKSVRASLRIRSDDLKQLSPLVTGGIGGTAAFGVEFDSKSGGDVFTARIDGKASSLTFGDPGMMALFGSEVVVGAQADGKLRGPATARGSVVAEGVHASGDASLDADGRTISGTFNSVLDNLARLSDRAAASIAGRLEATANVRGVLDNFSVRADLRGSRIVYEGSRFDVLAAELTADGLPDRTDAQVRASAAYGEFHAQLRARATMPDSDTLVLGDAVLEGPATRADAALRIGLRERSLSGTVKIAAEDLSRWRPFVGHGVGGRLVADLSMPASAQGAGHVTGTVALTDGSVVLESGEDLFVKSFNAAGRDLSVGGAPGGNAHADLVGARGGGMTVEKASFDIAGDGKRWLVSTNAQGNNGQPWTLAARTTMTPRPGQPAPQQPAGIVANVEAFDFTFGADSVHLQQPASVTWNAPDSISVAETTITIGQSGSVRFSGQSGAGGVRAEAELHSLPLSLASFVAPDLGLRGTIAGSVSLRGPSLAAASAEAHLDAHGLASRNLEESGLQPLDAVADARWAGGRLRGEASLGGLGNERVRLTVDVPLGDGAGSRDPISGALLWHGDVAELTSLLPLGEDTLKGAVNANLRLSGSVASPLVSGDLGVAGGSYEHAATGLVLREIEMKIAAQGSSLVLEKLTATDGERGRISASGRASFAALPAFSADMELHATSAMLARLDLITSRADTDVVLHLARASGAPTVEGSITGKVRIDEARINVPERFAAAIPELQITEINGVAAPGSRVVAPAPEVAIPASGVAAPGAAVVALQAHEPSPPPPSWNVALDVGVKGNNRVFVEGRGLESEWSPDLHLGGTLAAPRVTGVVRSVRGTLGLLGKRFDVTSAELRFDGSPSSIPYLTLTAEAKANDITAIVVANGPATTPTIEFRSDPALPADDVLSRLLFGKGAASLTPMQSVQLAQSLAELSGFRIGGGLGFIDKLGRSIGLDRLGIESGRGADAGSALSMSKYLTDKVYLSVQQGLTTRDSKASIEWEVYKNFRIESDISQDAQGEVGASWRWDY